MLGWEGWTNRRYIWAPELQTDGRGGRIGGGVCTVQPGVQSESDGRDCTVGLVYSNVGITTVIAADWFQPVPCHTCSSVKLCRCVDEAKITRSRQH